MLPRSTFFGFLVGAALAVVACTPREREAVQPYVGPATSIGCILLRAFTTSGTVDEVCATAEELAPFVQSILEARNLPSHEPLTAQELRVAFSVPPPARPVARRRCVAWEQIEPVRVYKDGGGVKEGGTNDR